MMQRQYTNTKFFFILLVFLPFSLAMAFLSIGFMVMLIFFRCVVTDSYFGYGWGIAWMVVAFVVAPYLAIRGILLNFATIILNQIDPFIPLSTKTDLGTKSISRDDTTTVNNTMVSLYVSDLLQYTTEMILDLMVSKEETEENSVFMETNCNMGAFTCNTEALVDI